jgi:hypothetical protein
MLGRIPILLFYYYFFFFGVCFSSENDYLLLS